MAVYEVADPAQLVAARGRTHRAPSVDASTLAARLIRGVRVAWNHRAFFAYADRWMTEDDSAALADLVAENAAQEIVGIGLSEPHAGSDLGALKTPKLLGAYARGGLRTRAERGLRKHLEECADCRVAAGQIKEVASSIPAVARDRSGLSAMASATRSKCLSNSR